MPATITSLTSCSSQSTSRGAWPRVGAAAAAVGGSVVTGRPLRGWRWARSLAAQDRTRVVRHEASGRRAFRLGAPPAGRDSRGG